MQTRTSWRAAFTATAITLVFLSSCSRERPSTVSGGNQPHYKVGSPYTIKGERYVPREVDRYEVTGLASWYGPQFHGKPTANGEIFDRYAITAAHKTLPLPSVARVTNLENGRTIVVRINDRGPFVGDRIIDLSEGSAKKLGFHGKGLAKVKVRYLPEESEKVQMALGKSPAKKKRSSNAYASSAPVSKITKSAEKTADERYYNSERLIGSASAAPLPDTDDRRNGLETAAYRIQAGAFSARENADKARAKLAALGPTYVEPVERMDGTTLHRVGLGPIHTSDHVLLTRVRALGYPDARIVEPEL